ncbi:MAG TPA: hypothetical protein VGR35_00645 [Tepidisphaeraceae bacterium]|nr:hypothetical protein [Tepidisphaeraceae bacterium]
MMNALRQLDRILRGDATRLSELRTGRIEIPAGGLALTLTALGVFYGACMGAFAITGSGSGNALQILASALKVPALFLLTLAVTFPSLYVFNALVGSRLRAESLLRLLAAAMAVMMAVLASMGTIVLFFSFSTTSYPFMVLLNVAVFAISGFLGLSFLLQTLHRISIAEQQPHVASLQAPPAQPPPLPDASPAPMPAPPANPGALDRTEGHVLGRDVKTVFRIWVIIFGLVGAQMSWILRPFVGDPNLKFTWFRSRESNFFIDVMEKIRDLF